MSRRKECSHGVLLPRGLRCDRGYLVITVLHKGRSVPHPNCGPHNDTNELHARERLTKLRVEIDRGRFGYEPELPERLFKNVVLSWLKNWKSEKDGDGRIVHTEDVIRVTEGILNRSLLPYFGEMKFHEINTVQIEQHREERLNEGVLGTTVNREHAVLSSIFSDVDTWIKRGKIEAFKQPFVRMADGSTATCNPCQATTKAALRKRERLLTKYEYRKLVWAFEQLGDKDGVQIVDMALESTLSTKDLMKLDVGQEIDIERAKTGVPINIPVTVLAKLDFTNWRKRWNATRNLAGLKDLQFRDLRKTGGNWLKGRHDIKLVSEYMGHADVKTTEGIYMVKQAEKLRPLQEDLHSQIQEAKQLPVD